MKISQQQRNLSHNDQKAKREEDKKRIHIPLVYNPKGCKNLFSQLTICSLFSSSVVGFAVCRYSSSLFFMCLSSCYGSALSAVDCLRVLLHDRNEDQENYNQQQQPASIPTISAGSASSLLSALKRRSGCKTPFWMWMSDLYV